MLEDEQGEAINRISYEWCVLTALREKVRCKEVWVRGAHRFRNPDEDLPQDFDVRRDEYYGVLQQPLKASVFVENLRRKMEVALTAFDANLPNHTKVKIVTTKKGKGRIRLTPLEEQPVPPNILALTAALVQRWPMTNLLDILKETELRVHFSEAFRTIGTRKSCAQTCYSAACCCVFTGSVRTLVRSARCMAAMPPRCSIPLVAVPCIRVSRQRKAIRLWN